MVTDNGYGDCYDDDNYDDIGSSAGVDGKKFY